MNLFPYSILILPNVNSSQCWINSADVVRKMTSTMRLWHSALLFILASAVAVPQATAASGWNFVKRKFSWISYILSHKRTPKKGKEILQKFWIIKFTVIQKKQFSILSFNNFSKLLSYILAGVFYNVKNGSSFITSKSSSENLSNQNKHFWWY